jgi:hypothetical protein
MYNLISPVEVDFSLQVVLHPFISSTVLLNCSNLFCRTSSSGLHFSITCSIKIAGILEKYGMHTPMELLISPPSKHMGKTMIKEGFIRVVVGHIVNN